MKLFTKEINEKLVKCGYENRRPIFKLFTPWSNCTWLVTGEEDGNLIGYCDLGMGCVEFGAFSNREEIESIRGPFGLTIERDLHWQDDDKTDYETRESLMGV